MFESHQNNYTSPLSDKQPGNYSISSLASYNAFVLAGGPGKMEAIETLSSLRNNKVFKNIEIHRSQSTEINRIMSV
jgi:hypothetical protein